VPKVSLFALPPRTRNAAASELLLDYRWFIVAAIASAIALLACRRTRLAD
jgi:hypothetical protein